MDFKTPLSSRHSDRLAPLLKTPQVAHCVLSSLQHPPPPAPQSFSVPFSHGRPPPSQCDVIWSQPSPILYLTLRTHIPKALLHPQSPVPRMPGLLLLSVFGPDIGICREATRIPNACLQLLRLSLARDDIPSSEAPAPAFTCLPGPRFQGWHC